MPVASELLALGPTRAHPIRTLLWTLLAELDELSPAIASVVQLLSYLYSQPSSSTGAGAAAGTTPTANTKAAHAAGAASAGAASADAASSATRSGLSMELTHQLPRLWPYLRHGLSEWVCDCCTSSISSTTYH